MVVYNRACGEFKISQRKFNLSFQLGNFFINQFRTFAIRALYRRRILVFWNSEHLKGEKVREGRLNVNKEKLIQDVFVYNARTYEKIIPNQSI